MNHRVMRERIAVLSKQLGASLAENEALDAKRRTDFVPKPVRGEVWAVDFELRLTRRNLGKGTPRTHISRCAGQRRASHLYRHTGTSNVESLPPSDSLPLRVRAENQSSNTISMLIDQIRAIDSATDACCCTLGANHLNRGFCQADQTAEIIGGG